MDAAYKDALISCGTDVDAALYRLSGNEDLYEQCLAMFLQDQSMDDLTRALQDGAWDDAFTAAHALKGVAGNMGFIPLYHAAAETVIRIRTGRTEELGYYLQQLKRCFDDVSDVIRQSIRDTTAE